MYLTGREQARVQAVGEWQVEGETDSPAEQGA